jgi:hypothetical protein
LAQQLQGELAGASIDDDDLYETIGDWLTTFQKIYAVFFVDLYALVDGDNPFYATKLDSVNVGLPEDIAGQYIQPLMEILQRVQKERIEAFNEELRRQQEEVKENPEDVEAKSSDNSTSMEDERFEFAYRELNRLLIARRWHEADELTARILRMASPVHDSPNRFAFLIARDTAVNDFPCHHLKIIDQLWIKNSNGKFGLSVQKRIFMSIQDTTHIKLSDSGAMEVFFEALKWTYTSNNVDGDKFYVLAKDFTFCTPNIFGMFPFSPWEFFLKGIYTFYKEIYFPRKYAPDSHPSLSAIRINHEYAGFLREFILKLDASGL